MTAPPQRIVQDSPPETLIAFDCRVPEARKRLYRERRAWGSRAVMESLGSGRVALVVRAGGAQELAR